MDTIGEDKPPEDFVRHWPEYAATWEEAAAIRRELDRQCQIGSPP
jgi:hypothetical protein